MLITLLPDSISPLLCLRPNTADRQPPRDQLPVRCQGRVFLLPRELYARAASIPVDALHGAGMVALGLHSADEERLGPAGFTADWSRLYRGHLKAMVALWRTQIEAEHAADATRAFAAGPSLLDEARALLRELPMLLQAGRARDALGYGSADLSSYAGVRDALWEVSGKLKVPAFQEALLGRGARPEQVARIPQLADALFEERTEQLFQQGKEADVNNVLQVVRAMALGDLTMLSTTARAQLPPEAWERYQLGRLLGRPERRDDPVAPPPEPTPVPPAPIAGPTPTPGSTPAPIAGAPAPVPAPSPGAIPAPAPIAGMAPAASTIGALPGATPTAPSAAPTSTLGAAPAAPPRKRQRRR